MMYFGQYVAQLSHLTPDETKPIEITKWPAQEHLN